MAAAPNCLTGVSHDRIDWTRRWGVVSAEYIRIFSSSDDESEWHIPSLLVNGRSVGRDSIMYLRRGTSLKWSLKVLDGTEIRSVILQRQGGGGGDCADNGDVTASEYATRFLLEILHTYVGVCRRYHSLSDILRNVKQFHEWCERSRKYCEHVDCVRRRRTVADSLREVRRLLAAQHQ